MAIVDKLRRNEFNQVTEVWKTRGFVFQRPTTVSFGVLGFKNSSRNLSRDDFQNTLVIF